MKALGETGIAAAAARTAGIGVRAAYKRRKANPTFAAAWDAAADLHRSEQAKQAMRAAGELAVSRRGGGQVALAGQTRWSRRGEEAFLTELAVTANVKRASAAAGFTPSGLYARRRKDPHFAQAWDAAVADGRARIEAFLVEAADRTFDPGGIADDAELPKMTIAEAIKVLQLAQGRSGRPARGSAEPCGRGWIGDPEWGTPEDEARMAEVREGIIGKLERLREREEREKLEAGWTKNGGHWVPPGYERRHADDQGEGPSPPPGLVMKALPPPEDSQEDVQGPRVRRL